MGLRLARWRLGVGAGRAERLGGRREPHAHGRARVLRRAERARYRRGTAEGRRGLPGVTAANERRTAAKGGERRQRRSPLSVPQPHAAQLPHPVDAVAHVEDAREALRLGAR